MSPAALLLLLLLLLCHCAGLMAEPSTPTKAPPKCPPQCTCKFITGKHGVQKLRVNCNNKQLTDVPDGIPAEANILDLSVNSIKAVSPKKLETLTQLEELHVTDNQLTALGPGTLTGLGALKKLYLTRNKFLNFPDVCADVGGSLTHLGLDQNQIANASVPDGYAKCSSLLSLVLTQNPLNALANSSLVALASGSLQSLKLNAAKLQTLQAGALRPVAHRLTSLDLSGNPDLTAADVTAAIGVAGFSKQFVGLTLKSMAWAELPQGFLPPGACPSLDTLHLGDSNRLASLAHGSLDGGPAITRLYLSNCPITRLDAQLSRLYRLREVNLAQSQLSAWTADTFGPSLQQLDLTGANVAFVGGADGKSNPLPHLASLGKAGLRLNGNPLVCNCSLLWLTQQLKAPTVLEKFYQPDKVTCTLPDGKGKVLLTECSPKNCDSKSTTASTTSAVTTSAVTTSAVTTSAVTTSAVTTSAVTTSAVTTSAVTTSAVTSSAVTSSAVTTTKPSGPQRQPELSPWVVPVISVGASLALILLALSMLVGVVRYRRSRRGGVSDVSDMHQLLGDDGVDVRGGCLERLSRGRRNAAPMPTDV